MEPQTYEEQLEEHLSGKDAGFRSLCSQIGGRSISSELLVYVAQEDGFEKLELSDTYLIFEDDAVKGVGIVFGTSYNLMWMDEKFREPLTDIIGTEKVAFVYDSSGFGYVTDQGKYALLIQMYLQDYTLCTEDYLEVHFDELEFQLMEIP